MAIILDISFGIDGLWTIQDNGNTSDGISEVRDPNGALFTTFLHPGDSVTLLSRAGQNVTVNLTESLGTASFTVGSLTSTSTRPDAIFVGQVSSSSIVTLTANQAIVESGDDAATDISAGTLLLDAGTGIGSGGNPIETQVAQVEGESVTGGIALSNSGDVIVGGATAELRGLFTGTSGNIALTNGGSISLADATGAQSISSAGNIALIAIGAATDITSIVNNDALFATGDLNLSAGRDILFGTGGANFDNDMRAGGGIFVTAGNDFHIDGNADMLANDAGTASNGGIQILVGGDILIEDSTGTSASIGVSTGTGGILLATGAGGTLSLGANSASAVFAGSGGVTVSADRVLIESDSGITTTGSGAIVITGASAIRNIILGSVTDAAAAVELSDTELDRLFTQNAIIGNQFTGQVAVQAAITHPNANLTLQSQSDILIQASISAVTSLTLRAGDTVTQSGATTISTGTLDTFVDTPDLDAPGGQSSFAGTVSVTSSTITGNADADTLIGTGDDDALVGAAGDDALDGRSGADQMIGGLGNDTYVVDNAGDVVTEAAAAGTDTVQSSITYTLGATLEKLTLIGGAIINGTGNALSNTIIGNSLANTLTGLGGHDTLDGGLGGDTMVGGFGNDTYIVDHAGDTVSEISSSGGSDTVRSTIAYTLTANVETLVLTGTANINGTGNGIANTLFGNDGNNMLDGGGGIDSLRGGLGNDTYVITQAGDIAIETSPAGGSDTVRSAIAYTLGANIETLILTGVASVGGTGNNGANTLFGNDGNNMLDGAGGADSMRGGLGNDIYVIAQAGDIAIETDPAGGTDTVQSSLSLTLGTNLENLVLTGTAAIDGTGNALNNIITGNSNANLLNGGGGVDNLRGGDGDDTYIISDAGDAAIETLAAGGNDLVRSSISFQIGANIEELQLTGTGAINGTGNSLDNVITGNNAVNTLNGGIGADTMIGGLGDDLYIVDNGGDQAIEASAGGGTDLVQASATFTLGALVENLTLTGSSAINGTGNALANTINGNGSDNVLDGGAGNDLINAGAGADTLWGGLGIDTLNASAGNDKVHGGLGNDILSSGSGTDEIYFDTALNAFNNVDAITDFSSVGDTLFLDDTVFTGLATGALAAGAFRAGAAALDADDRILYDSATGHILFDADGVGGSAAILFATVNPATLVTSADFIVF